MSEPTPKRRRKRHPKPRPRGAMLHRRNDALYALAVMGLRGPEGLTRWSVPELAAVFGIDDDTVRLAIHESRRRHQSGREMARALLEEK